MPKRTPLYAEHQRLNAHFVEFGGWEMPVYYTGISDEHLAVREAIGLFDISHMGILLIEGEGYVEFLQEMTTNDVRLILGKESAQYSMLLNERGTVIDDILIYNMPSAFMVVVNAGNTDKAFTWLKDHAPASVHIHLINDKYTLIALQGPKAEALLQPVTKIDLKSLKYYGFSKSADFRGTPCIISRSGYTGEAGFELFVNPAFVTEVWSALLAQGQSVGLKPCGLGARDTLRLEVAFPLYGHEIDDTLTPLHAGLDRFVKLEKGDFMGRGILQNLKTKGLSTKLVGFELHDRAIARQGYAVHHGGKAVGTITSGTFSPVLKKSIAIGYVPQALSAPGIGVSVDIRGRQVNATVVALPHRPSKR